MLALKKVAITGGLASGKSTVCRLFAELGAVTADADQIVHQLLSSSESPIVKEVVALLGEEILREGKVDRSEIAKQVFTSPVKLEALEKILHPRVREEIQRRYRESSTKTQAELFVVEIPLLFETGSDQDYDITIAVVADEQQCHDRFVVRHGNQEAYYQRMKRQLDPKEKAAFAHFTIVNRGTLAQLRQQVINLYQQLVANTPL